ncbi:hypothetical protein [Salinisphaera sp. G21_0]|uniref:hypothetical protein n=1 Tax=Salinisphaera sp. G21_0 TaxID=2821094 RepID=UPI001ADC07C9|nr:hypothetical protein [Salinisphaera sp. G21_0]MBO9481092.1 hypothetical protein [Salinisphaera sp. G21_0]
MNNLSPPNTLLPASDVPPSKESEQIAQAFAGLREVKPSDIDNEHSECPPEIASYSLQKRTVAMFFGDRFTRLRAIADSPFMEFALLADINLLELNESGCLYPVYDSTFKTRNEIQIPDTSSLSISGTNNSGASSSEKIINRYDSIPATTTLRDEVLKCATEVLSYPPDQNWSKRDAHLMTGIALTSLGHLHHLHPNFPSDRKTIEQKISELNEYVSRLKAAYELDDQENTNVIFDWPWNLRSHRSARG